MMDGQDLINIVGGAVLSALGWFARILWEADKELREDLSKLREELPHSYVAKGDYREDIKELKAVMERILDKLDQKADKGGQ